MPGRLSATITHTHAHKRERATKKKKKKVQTKTRGKEINGPKSKFTSNVCPKKESEERAHNEQQNRGSQTFSTVHKTTFEMAEQRAKAPKLGDDESENAKDSGRAEAQDAMSDEARRKEEQRKRVEERKRRNAELARLANQQAQELAARQAQASAQQAAQATTKTGSAPLLASRKAAAQAPSSSSPSASASLSSSSSAAPASEKSDEFFIPDPKKNPHVYVTGLPLVRTYFHITIYSCAKQPFSFFSLLVRSCFSQLFFCLVVLCFILWCLHRTQTRRSFTTL